MDGDDVLDRLNDIPHLLLSLKYLNLSCEAGRLLKKSPIRDVQSLGIKLLGLTSQCANVGRYEPRFITMNN